MSQDGAGNRILRYGLYVKQNARQPFQQLQVVVKAFAPACFLEQILVLPFG